MGAHTAGSFDLRVFPGGHFFVTEHIGAVSALVTELLGGPAATAPAPGLPPLRPAQRA